MVIKRNWMDYASSLPMEWQQAMDEGKDVADFENICLDISNMANSAPNDAYIATAVDIYDKMRERPQRAGYAYSEPSSYAEIRSAVPKENAWQSGNPFPAPEVLRDKIRAAWQGRISGCLLGKPIEGMMSPQINRLLELTGNFPMRKYICKKDFAGKEAEIRGVIGEERWNREWADTLNGISPMDDDTNYTVLALKILENYGVNFTPQDVLEAWVQWMPVMASSTAERITYRNALLGFTASETAEYHNPCREWIGAQIRADFYGYINPGNPVKAAEMAWRDASISHVKNGIYGAMMVSAMISAAFVCDSVDMVVGAGLSVIPEHCRLRYDVNDVIQWHAQGTSHQETICNIHSRYHENESHGWCHTNPNAMVVVAALLYGMKSFEKTLCLSVGSAFDTDCNGATVGSIVGVMNGTAGIPACWTNPFCDRLCTSITGFQEVSIDTLVEKTYKLCQNNKYCE